MSMNLNERNPGRILIVDDEPALLGVMEQYLRRIGYEVAACGSGKQAWELFESNPEAFSMVLADITMPGMSGQEMLLRMLGLNPAIHVLICSGYPFDVNTLPAAIQRQTGFLPKPFSPKMLAEAIERLLSAQAKK